MKHCVFATLLVLGVGQVCAQTIYKCIDANGGTLISSTRVDKNCKAISTASENTAPVPSSGSAASPGRARVLSTTPSPAGFPRVSEDAQKSRDNDRRMILEQEMTTERQGLERARRDLVEQEAIKAPQGTVDRLAPYRDRVAQHERNIQALQKELGNLR